MTHWPQIIAHVVKYINSKPSPFMFKNVKKINRSLAGYNQLKFVQRILNIIT